MIELVNTTQISLTANQQIPVGGVTAQSNSSATLTNDSIQINRPGYYGVSGQFTVTGTAAGDVTVQLYANGSAIPGALATETLTEGGNATLNLSKVVKVLPSNSSSKVALTFKTSTACTLTNAVTEVQRII